ncbi:unnamed protein product [Phaedon cochleariae]|uniref:ASCH domain-containing protein n=1 Tax=Phaedon cochleariae TaxID=80249 RepID=A0A9N9SGV7_PHACE|nr:unnamed protein product [Phaedon cochleariae]
MADTALVNYLKIILGDDVSNDIVSYIRSIELEEDYAEFMENILDRSKSSHITAFEGIRNIIFRKQQGSKKPSSSTGAIPKNTGNQNSSRQNSISSGKKGKTKFKDINTYEIKKKEKEGKLSACDCLGQEHEFMNNCLVCGRIHCMEEGPGPCLFCGNPISVRGDVLFDANNRKSKTIMKPRENKVFDDDNDYFKTNSKKAVDEDGKKKMIIALDFASRKVIEGTQEDARIRERLLQDSVEHLKKVEEAYKNIQKRSEQSYQRNQNINEDLVHLLIQMRHKKPAGKEEDLRQEDGSMPVIDYGTRVFDEELMANMDHGLCLSLHQPYASLLVAGVKKHEGRTWPTTHRGKLWIAAAAKPPEEDEIDALESFYRDYYQDSSLKFPKDYPTSCLLGCIYVDDCLEQEAYRKKYPHGESNSPFVMICSNPIILPIFYPIVGQHKIYPLDKELHKCAKMALQHAKYVM